MQVNAIEILTGRQRTINVMRIRSIDPATRIVSTKSVRLRLADDVDLAELARHMRPSLRKVARLFDWSGSERECSR